MEAVKKAKEKMNEQIAELRAELNIVEKAIAEIKGKKDLSQWDGKRLYMAYRAKEIGERLLKEMVGN